MDYGKINRYLWLLGVAYWLFTWFGNKKTAQHYNPGRRLAALVATVFVYWILYHSNSLVDVRILPYSDLMGPLSSILCAAGIAIAIWARTILGRNWSANPTIKEGHELITRGPYRFVRHPIYTGILLAMVGSPVVADGRLRSVLFFAFVAIGLHFKSKVEEGLMMQTFPNSYPEYCRRTKAIIPFIL
jgi:protein-S-isoprenylcysteine O-methyltransferase Ste14